MVVRALGLLVTFGLMSECWAVQISVVGDPPLPAANLVANPSMEQGDAEPASWRFGTATPENFEARWEDTGHTGSRSPVMSGYWSQTVPLPHPGEYVFSGYYRTSGGRLLMYVHARYQREGLPMVLDERFYTGNHRGHWLTPVFLPSEALTDPPADQWQSFSIRFTAPPELTAVSFSLGSYFSPGEVWFDDISLQAARTDPTDTVRSQGACLASVKVVDGAGNQVYSSPEPGQLPEVFELVVPGVDAGQRYEIVAVSRDGTQTRVGYPTQGGQGQ